MSKIPTYAEVEEWHLIDKIKIADWLDEMFKKLKEEKLDTKFRCDKTKSKKSKVISKDRKRIAQFN